MQLSLFSDLHLDHFAHPEARLRHILHTAQPKDPFDTIAVLAGDIGDLTHTLRAYGAFAERFAYVVAIAGNHEFYDMDHDLALKALRGHGLPNVHFLENEALHLCGQRFVGCTLWYPDSIDARLRTQSLADFSAIRLSDGTRWARYVFAYAAASASWLRRSVRDGDIVVTHTLPTEAAVSPRYRHNPLNCYFVHPLDDILKVRAPLFWLHGHSHDALDMTVEKTRLLRNPGGYPGESDNLPFAPALVRLPP